MHKKAKNFSCALLMLILLLNLSSFLHTMLHIQICPEVFCSAQHDSSRTSHLEARHLPFAVNDHCSVCEYNQQNNSIELSQNFFSLTSPKQQIESFEAISADSIQIFHNSSRAPPAV